MAAKLVEELLKVNPAEEAGKSKFYAYIGEFEDM